VLDRESTAAEVDFVRREFEKVSGDVQREFAERAQQVSDELEQRMEDFLGEDEGAVARALDQHAEGLAEELAKHFGGDRNTAVQHQVRELVARALGESRAELLKQFSAEDGHNPLAAFKTAVTGELRRYAEVGEGLIEKVALLEGELKRLHDAREAEAELDAERERGTAKGRAFEDAAFELVDSMAAARGDMAHHVGNERSERGGKKGDVVIEVDAAQGPSRGRIVLDMKDERLSRNEAWRVLNESLAERDATFGILLVASEERVPARTEPLHEYEGNKMIVPLDRDSLDPTPLDLAYRYARCRLLMGGEGALELDAAGVRQAADEALAALKEAQKIRNSLTGAAKGVEGARATLDAMIDRVRSALERVESLIGSAGADSSSQA
jgi:hypothetical protein